MNVRKLSTTGKFAIAYAVAMVIAIATCVLVLYLHVSWTHKVLHENVDNAESAAVLAKANELTGSTDKKAFKELALDSADEAHGGIWVVFDGNDGIVYSSNAMLEGWTDEGRLAGALKLYAGHLFDFDLRKEKYAVFSARVYGDWNIACLKLKSSLYKSIERTEWYVGLEIFLLFLVIAFLTTLAFIFYVRLLQHRRSKSMLLESAGRDIRDQANGIFGMTRILLRELGNADHRDYVKNVQAASLNLLNIVTDIQEIAHIESGKMALSPTEYDLYSVLKECFNAISPKATAKNLHFSLECDPEIPSCLWGDEARIRQIIVNLLSNAILYTEVGEVCMIVGYDIVPRQSNSKLDEEIRLKITIKDSGNGVRDDVGASLLDRMLQLDGSNPVQVGFSLQLTKRLVAMFGGELLVKSRYGEGSVYMLSIPQLVLNVEAMGDFAARYKNELQVGKENVEAIYAPSARILVVDDVEFNLKVACGLLKETLVQVDTALSGVRALEMVHARHYDLILLDSMMPMMNGMDTYERMTRIVNSPNRNTPVIIMISGVSDMDQASYLNAGFADYIPKPLMEGDLLRVLRWYLPKQLVVSHEDIVDLSAAGKDEKLAEKEQSTKSMPLHQPSSEGNLELQFTSSSIEEQMSAFSAFLDLKAGFKNCANNVDFYREMLHEYVDDSKKVAIESAYDEGDWEHYGVHVHSLKSMSFTIGAEALANEAKALEMAVKENSIDYVRKNHRRVMDMYVELVRNIVKGLES